MFFALPCQQLVRSLLPSLPVATINAFVFPVKHYPKNTKNKDEYYVKNYVEN
jgi:hypothetical protein